MSLEVVDRYAYIAVNSTKQNAVTSVQRNVTLSLNLVKGGGYRCEFTFVLGRNFSGDLRLLCRVPDQ